MITTRESIRIRKIRQDWKERFNEMRLSFRIMEEAYRQLPWNWIFWKKAKMHGLVNKNEKIFNMADDVWEKHGFSFFEEKDKEFKSNHELYMKLFIKKRDKIMKKKKEFDLSYWGRAGFRR